MAEFELTPEKLAEIKQKAAGCDPKYWIMDQHGDVVAVDFDNEVSKLKIAEVEFLEDAEHIAAADPATVLAMVEEIERLQEIVDNLLDHCPHIECSKCSEIVCPHNSRLHLHHDGCPECFHHLEESEAGQ